MALKPMILVAALFVMAGSAQAQTSAQTAEPFAPDPAATSLETTTPSVESATQTLSRQPVLAPVQGSVTERLNPSDDTRGRQGQLLRRISVYGI